jgi:prephenate dehydrogenase
VQKIDYGRWDVREAATRVLLAIRNHRPMCIGIEKGSLMRAIMPYLQDLMRKNGVYAHIEPIATSGKGSKVNRITYALQGLMEHGRVTFNPDEDWGEVKREMMGFPSQRVHDDLIEAISFTAYLSTVSYGRADDSAEDWEPIDLVAGV